MHVRSTYRRVLALAAPIAIGGAIFAATAESAHANDDPTEARERCAIRLSAALLGKSPSPELFASPEPQARVDAMLDDDAFVERAARFLNATFNKSSIDVAAVDSTYQVARHVFAKKLPFRELFVGHFALDADGNVKSDENGLGYFRDPSWMRRYAGSEGEGYRLVKFETVCLDSRSQPLASFASKSS